MQLRDYQTSVAHRCFDAWNNGIEYICLVMPTGAGKTHTKTWIAREMNRRTMCIAHRQELVLQISESLAAFGIYHRVIAPNAVIKFCAERHIKKFGRSFVDHQAKFCVAGVQTLVRRAEQYKKLCGAIQLWDIDECHHVLPGNQWGQAVSLFPNALGLGVTATPVRCDRKPLSGTFEHMVVGPTMRDLINRGFLTDYRIFCPPQSVDRNSIRVSQSTNEFIKSDMNDKIHQSRIVGDVVKHYLQLAAGKRGLTFTVDVEEATKTAAAFNLAGVPAQVVTGKTPDRERAEYLDMLAEGRLLQLINVDLFGEGMDCPALEVVSMARPTQSYGLFTQQFGRALRTMEGKDRAIIIDHVGNAIAHGLPDAPRQWSLEGGLQRAPRVSDEIPMRACATCMQPYRRTHTQCPYCGAAPVIQSRGGPEFVDGDLEELDPAVLAQMRGEVISLQGDPLIPYGASAELAGRKWKDHRAMVTAQTELRDCISAVAGAWKYGEDMTDREIHKRMWLSFGMTVDQMCALRRADAVKMTEKLREVLT